MILFIVPKNSGLEKCREIAKSNYKNIPQVIVRGEDVPLLVKRMLEEDKNTIGITGEDLFREFLLNFKNSGLKILKKFSWADTSSIFGKPCLCLLGPKSKGLENLPKNLRVCINKKYARISKKYLSTLENICHLCVICELLCVNYSI